MTVTINGTTGVTAPEVTLDNSSADGGQVVLKSSGYSNWNWDNYSGNLRAYYGSTEAMRIDSSGNLLVGTTSVLGSAKQSIQAAGVTNIYAANSSAGGYSLECDQSSNGGTYYMINFKKNGTGISNITSNGTTISYNGSSDYRLKHSVQDMENALDTVAKLRPVTFKWNANDQEDNGFIAHELQSVLPNAVTGEKDAVDSEGNPMYQGVDQRHIVATLTKAIQELTARVEQLEAK